MSATNTTCRQYKPADLTFPARLHGLAFKFVQQAKAHPAFLHLSLVELQRTIENRLWSLASKYPDGWGSAPRERRKPTEAQLAALAKARTARQAQADEEATREARLHERIAETAATT
jgi:formylglycine-generating enzyme required for sulfatase activity